MNDIKKKKKKKEIRCSRNKKHHHHHSSDSFLPGTNILNCFLEIRRKSN